MSLFVPSRRRFLFGAAALIAAPAIARAGSLMPISTKFQDIGHVIYVRTDGDDLLGSGQSHAPFSSIQRAVDFIKSMGPLAEPKKIKVCEGTYPGSFKISDLAWPLRLEAEEGKLIRITGDASISNSYIQMSSALIPAGPSPMLFVSNRAIVDVIDGPAALAEQP